MSYPDDIDTFREIENLPGLTYDPDDKKTFFMEDLQAVRDSILAIENFIGPEPDLASSDFYLAIADLLYPVGRIVEFGADIDPNTQFGFGTWAVYGEGRVTVAQDAVDPDFDTIGETGGSASNTHQHWQSVGADTNNTFQTSPATTGLSSRVVSRSRKVTSTSSYSTSNTREDTTYDETIDIMNPYIVVKRWIRTA